MAEDEAAQAMRTGNDEAQLVACWTGSPYHATSVPGVLCHSSQPQQTQ